MTAAFYLQHTKEVEASNVVEANKCGVRRV